MDIRKQYLLWILASEAIIEFAATVSCIEENLIKCNKADNLNEWIFKNWGKAKSF